MKKIGIITQYHNSRNYGGILQAYSLTEAVSKLQCTAEQISFNLSSAESNINNRAKIIYAIKEKIANPIIVYRRLNRKNFLKRREQFSLFRNKIPHSETIYSSKNINECVNDYDVFITGSDQVWNMDWYYKEYFLDFVPDSKRKISYGASMPNINLSDEQKQIVYEHLKSFHNISVREKETADYLEKLTGREVSWVLDPTLLLSKDDWDEICAERVVKEKYIFCYFLGTDKGHRHLALKFAKKMGYKIVTLPHLIKVNKNDITFGHIKLYDISPEQFISLIRYAEYVITDSFHATVFANIYQTKYFVFDRIGDGKMSSRIKSLVSLTGEHFRFCTGEKLNAEYMLTKKDIAVPQLSDELLEMKEKSIEFLKRNLA